MVGFRHLFLLASFAAAHFFATLRVKEFLFEQSVLFNDVVDVGVGLSWDNSRVFWHACTRYTHALVQMVNSVKFRVLNIPVGAKRVLFLAFVADGLYQVVVSSLSALA